MLKEFFSKTFAPYFTIASLAAIFYPMYLVCIFINGYHFENKFFTEVSWHSHEMLFGFVPAILMGFLFTAASNWTGKSLTSLKQNIGLVILWIVIRFIIFSGHKILILAIAPSFLLILISKTMRYLRGNRNFLVVNTYLILLILGQILLIISNIYDYDLTREAYIFAMSSIFGFLFTFSSRLVPFFTNNYLKRPVVRLNSNIEKMTYVTMSFLFLFLILNIEVAVQILSLFSVILLVYRTWCLFIKEALKVPMVLILSIAHLWLPIFSSFIFLESYYPEYMVGRPAFHSLFVGALALFALSIMTRASLGHSGRPIKADFWIKFAFCTMTLGAYLRVFRPLVQQEVMTSLLHTSMGFWTLGFIVFLFKFVPIYIKPRL